MPAGIQNFYYTRTTPDRAVEIAEIRAALTTPADLTDINDVDSGNQTIAPGAYSITGYPVQRVFDAHTLGNAIAIQGSTTYLVKNQFFELSNVDANGAPMFYAHKLPADVSDVTVVNLDGSPSSGFLVRDGRVYHSFDGSPKWVRYYSNRLLTTELLQYAPALTAAASVSLTSYVYTHSVIRTFSTGRYWIRWVDDNGYRVIAPYTTLPNDPWYARVRFSANPVPPEWAQQMFRPYRPYQLATWVPGKVLARNLVEFERRPILFNGSQYPDILVFDQDYNLKHAIDGSPVNTPLRKGFLYPWKRAQYAGIDPFKARAHVVVDLEETDLVFGFYYYAEPDVVFRGLDLNPFTNPAIKGRVVEFYYADRSSDIPPRA